MNSDDARIFRRHRSHRRDYRGHAERDRRLPDPRHPDDADLAPRADQGASLATEDALVLAKCLRDIPDTERAFAAYERLRRGRAEKVVAYSRRIGSSKTAGPIARWFRDLMMPLALKYLANSTSHTWLYTYHVGWDEKVPA